MKKIELTDITPIALAQSGGRLPTAPSAPIGARCITADLWEIWAAEMRIRHSNRELPGYIAKALEVLPGWTWFTATCEGIMAEWGVRADAALAEACKPGNEHVVRRIEEVRHLRDKLLELGTEPPHRAAALKAISELEIEWAISTHYDLLRMAAVDHLCRLERGCDPGEYDVEQDIAQTSCYHWTREHFEQMHGLTLPEDEDGWITTIQDPLKADVEANLRRAIHRKLGEIEGRSMQDYGQGHERS